MSASSHSSQSAPPSAYADNTEYSGTSASSGLVYTKSLEQRRQERREADYPLCDMQADIMNTLKMKKVSFIDSDLDSAYKTLLPQLCAETFGGRILLILPSAENIKSVAEDISNQFDGCPCGENVGYQLGDTCVPGDLILVTTDLSLLTMSFSDSLLKDIRVMIIDNAHERALNTDISLGLAKLILAKRSDFHVVIASAAIDPKPFIDFFFPDTTVMMFEGMSLNSPVDGSSTAETPVKKVPTSPSHTAEVVGPVKQQSTYATPSPVSKLKFVCYRATECGLNKDHLMGFRAAGILPVRFCKKLEVLLPLEYRHGEGLVLHVLGGKVETSETPQVTAAREFHEEIGKLVSYNTVKSLLAAPSCEMLWLGFGKFVLYVVPACDELNDMPERYAALRHKNEATALKWVPWDSLSTSKGKDSPSIFLKDFLKQDIAHEAVVTVGWQKVLERSSELKKRSRTDVLGKNWQLKVTTPPLPKSTSIEVVSPASPEHRAAVAAMPQGVQQGIVSVRKVNVSSRLADYIARKTHATGGEICPVYHGTPDTWRATAIAFNGFDLSIRLCGRALGDGVYSSTDPNVAMSYCGGKGSILRMTGLLTNPVPTISGTVYVFPDPKNVLPLTIIDYNTVTPDQDLADLAAQQEKLKEETKKMKEEIATREKQYAEDTWKLWQECVAVYEQRVAMLTTAADLTHTQRMDLVLRETTQLEAFLPIYASKNKILEALSEHDVLVVQAAAGSGKSTQLPQYILDDILTPAKDSRKIAVLQPRRQNCKALCSRVARERFSEPGDVVGYRLGLGDANSGIKTQIEYMTHGYFLSIALDHKDLISQYAAVIVDEAHERTVQVDLSLAVLREVLSTPDLTKSFKVLVSSATIASESQRISDFLAVNGRSGQVLDLQGKMFPVYVAYRDECQVPADEVGTLGVGKVSSSYAAQVALDLLASTDTGNVLVFLPGEHEIDCALKAIHQVLRPNDEFASDYCAQGFTAQVKKSESKSTYRLGVYPCHSKAYPVLSLTVEDQRMVILATNFAETGLTFPDVRYVVDTGLERVVQWHSEADLCQMTTTRVSASSMMQRTGRAGRTASGICVRLYPKEVAESLDPARACGMETSQLLTTVLRLHQHKLVLLDDIPLDVYNNTCAILLDLGAIDKDGKITLEGHDMLRIGIDLRLCRFLLACNVFGCLASGIKVTALLLSDLTDLLLPKSKPKVDDEEPVQSEVSITSDHITLLNLYLDYSDTSDKANWCKSHDVSTVMMELVDSAVESLQERLYDMGYNLDDDKTKISRYGGLEGTIRKALCSAYFDQLAITIRAGSPVDGFTWLADACRSSRLQAAVESHRSRTAPKTAVAHGDDAQGDVTGPQTPGPSAPCDTDDLRIRLTRRSALWLDQSNAYSMVVFSSLLQTENSVASLSRATYVTPEDIETGAPHWCKHVEFPELYAANKVHATTIKLDENAKALLLRNKGAALKPLRNKYANCSFHISSDKLHVSCPERLWPLVEQKLKRVLSLKAESVTLKIDPKDVGRFLGKGGANKKALLDDINDYISQACGRGTPGKCDIKLDSTSGLITISIEGQAKKLGSYILGLVRSAVCNWCTTTNKQDVPVEIKPSGGGDGDAKGLNANPRLCNLATTSCVLSRIQTREDLAFVIAHCAIHTANCTIFGGFIRDWVIRDEPANDIDLEIGAGTTAQATINLLTSAVSRYGISTVSTKDKGKAMCVTYAHSSYTIDVDFVDRTKIHSSPPGVEADVCNMCIRPGGRLCKRIDSVGKDLLPLSKCKSHCENKKFVFLYNPNTNTSMVLTRLNKLLSKGYTCLSPLPNTITSQLSHYSHLLQPKPKYDVAWWSL